VHSVSPYPNTVLAVWQLALIAVVALSGIAGWLGAVFYAGREPRARDHAAASGPLAHGPALAHGPDPAGEPESTGELRAAA
jgi:hypothetical protein